MPRRGRAAASAALTIFLTALAGAPVQAASKVVLDRVAAVVGDEVILESELRQAVERNPAMQEALAALPTSATPQLMAEKRAEVESQVLRDLIDQALVRAEARKFDITVTEDEVDRAAADVASQYGLSVEELQAQVEQSADYGSWQEYRDELRDQILQLKVPHYLASYSVSEAQVREHYRKLTKDEAAKVRVVEFVVVPPSQESGDRDRAFAQAQAIGRQLRDGVDVATIQQGSVPSQERLAARGGIAPELEQAIFAAKAGDVVGPLGSGRGYSVFKVIEHQESAALSYEEAKDRIRQQLEGEAFMEAQAQLRQELRAKAHIDIRL